MQTILIILLAAAAAATLYALVRGLAGMAQGSSTINSARSQSLMQKRVTYQAAAILIAVLLIMRARGS